MMKKMKSLSIYRALWVVTVLCSSFCCACLLKAGSTHEVSSTVERRVLPPIDEPTPAVEWTRIPYYESRPEFVPNKVEKERGFALFTRPIVDAIYPESRPGEDERVTKLEFFAAGNQFQTLNFAVYPLENLPKLRIATGKFTNVDKNADKNVDKNVHGTRDFPAENIQVRLVTYRGIRYPQYSSKEMKYRVLPEYLQDVTYTDAPALEPQRYFITFRVPEGTQAGKYVGNVTITWGDDGNKAHSAELPITLHVLNFNLLCDPTKNYSAYYYAPKNADGTCDWGALEREFAAMRDYGFTRSPVYHMSYDSEQKRYYFKDIDRWVATMRKNGMNGPIPVIGGATEWFATHYYGANIAKHVAVLTPPRDDFYTFMDELCLKLKEDVDALPEGTPAMVFGPLDETSPEGTEFGVRVYKSFHDAGLATYTTKEPKDPTFLAYDNVVDIYASQVFSPSYAETQKRHKQEYWCYPNHNSYERKDMIIMCKGGRMTYGFGFWRSGFDLLIPWIWRANKPQHFDLTTSSGGNLLHPETGEVIMTTYWECFREGINDLKYLYTLETYIIQREGTDDKKLNAEIQKSRNLLQEIWDSIFVQEKYLNRNLWESEKFDDYRKRIAKQILALSEFQPTNNKVAPSVIIEPREIKHVDKFSEECEANLAKNQLRRASVSMESCKRSEAEATVEIVTGNDVPPGAQNSEVALLSVKIDKKHDGSSKDGNGPYPANWPAMACYVTEKAYTEAGIEKPRGLMVRLYCDSNRTLDVDKFPIHIGINPGRYSYNVSWEFKAKTWYTIFLPLENSGYDGMPPTTARPATIRFTISENNHNDDEVIKVYFDEISFVD